MNITDDIHTMVAEAMPLPVRDIRQERASNGCPVVVISMDSSSIPGAPSDTAEVNITFEASENADNPALFDRKLQNAARLVEHNIRAVA